jgi:hypothetical protein
MITAKRLYYGLMVALAAIIVLSAVVAYQSVGWLKDHSTILVDKKLENIALEEQQSEASSAAAILEQYSDLRETVEAVAPSEKEQEKIIAELYRIAAENNLTIQSLTFPNSELGETQTAPAAQSQGGEAAATEQQAAPQPSNQITQTRRVDGLTGVVGLDIAPSGIKENGVPTGMTYETMLRFLDSLEKNRRQMIVNEIAINPIRDESFNGILYNLDVTLTALIAQ